MNRDIVGITVTTDAAMRKLRYKLRLLRTSFALSSLSAAELMRLWSTYDVATMDVYWKYDGSLVATKDWHNDFRFVVDKRQVEHT